MSLDDYTNGRSWQHLFGVGPSLAELGAAKRRAPGAKISRDVAMEIRQRLAAGAMGKDLAAEYGVHKATISDIKRGKIWKEEN